jgi:3-hydroxyisobutyrate dehydrogenase-like beta-hydroxyacid dehydrogenase
MDTESSVGFVGIGRMGLPIARHLLQAGVRVLGYKRSSIQDFLAAGGEAKASPAEVFAQARVVFTCLPDDAAIEAVVNGPNGFLSSTSRDRIVVDFSTTRLAARMQFGEMLRVRGSTMLDCPISGIPAVVERRKAVFLASGDRVAFDAVERFLRIVSENVVYLGPLGSGTKAKYIANYLLTVHVAAAAEAVAMAERSGLDVAQALAAFALGAGSSFQLTQRGARMVSSAYRPAPATLGELTKDLGLIGEFANSLGLQSALLTTATSLVNQTIDLGFGDCDPAAVLEAVRAHLDASASTHSVG